MERKFVCIRCPQGCEITTTLNGNGAITEITGNSCRIGADFVKAELTDARRTLTTTVRVSGGTRPLCPVWTEKPVPKDKVLDLAAQLRTITLNAPVSAGQIIIKNAAGTGINIVASAPVMAPGGK